MIVRVVDNSSQTDGGIVCGGAGCTPASGAAFRPERRDIKPRDFRMPWQTSPLIGLVVDGLRRESCGLFAGNAQLRNSSGSDQSPPSNLAFADANSSSERMPSL